MGTRQGRAGVVNRLVSLGISFAMAAAVPAANPPSRAVDFYGTNVTVLKLFGQQRWGECSPGAVDGRKIYHAAGVIVDRSVTPNAVYVADTGNNRILGFRRADSPKADLVFGQPDAWSGAPNGDCNFGSHARPTRTSLCLMNVPENTNLAEQWMRLHIDLDGAGNLYVPDYFNNRVLVYYAPFSADKSGGKGDALADLVIGQDDFTSNGVNRGAGPQKRDARSLFLSFGGFDHVASRGVSVDSAGNVWVADTFNYRVLRFPRGQATADLVVGQSDFATAEPTNRSAPDKARLDRMCTPTIARIDPDTGELYVIDEYPGGFRSRILVFKPPFQNGMTANRVIRPQQPLRGDYKNGYAFTHATGLVFNPVKTDDWTDPEAKTHRYRDGVVWVHDLKRTLLLDANGTILVAMNTTDVGKQANTYQVYADAGLDPARPFNLIWPGGMIGFDAQNNIYLADEHAHRVARYALPYRLRPTTKGPAVPAANGGLFPGIYEIPNSVGPANFSGSNVGAITFGNQLIVRDLHRYMAWNDYLAKPSGAAADVIIGQADGHTGDAHHIYGRATHAVDHRGRLWACTAHGKLMVFQLPLTAGARPLRELIPLYWADEPDKEVDFRCEQPLAFDPHAKVLWVYDTPRHRLLRVKNPDDYGGKLLVDAVIGQTNKTAGGVNRGMAKPDAASFGDVNDLKFDRRGNMFVVDNTYELHHNGRILAFLAEDLKATTGMFPDVRAKRVYVASAFDEPVGRRTLPKGQSPHSPVSVAFNSRNEMVVGNDGYFRDARTRHVNQLYLYRRPLEKPTPDAVIGLPLGAPGEISFDEKDNLIVQDHTWSKVWVINFDRDRDWLRELK